MTKIIPFKIEQELLICGYCFNDDGLFHIGTDFVAFCINCGWTVRLKSTTYPDLREYENE
jgi:hypothetical protein